MSSRAALAVPDANGSERRVVATAVLVVMVLALGGFEIEQRPDRPTGTAGATTVPHTEIIVPEGVARLPVFSPAVRVGDLLFLSGAIGTVGDELRLVEGGVGPETRQTLQNIEVILAAAGATMADLVKCTVFLADIADYAAMNEVYLEFFPSDPPARSAMAGSGLALGARVEIECIAAMPVG